MDVFSISLYSIPGKAVTCLVANNISVSGVRGLLSGRVEVTSHTHVDHYKRQLNILSARHNTPLWSARRLLLLLKKVYNRPMITSVVVRCCLGVVSTEC